MKLTEAVTPTGNPQSTYERSINNPKVVDKEKL